MSAEASGIWAARLGYGACGAASGAAGVAVGVAVSAALPSMFQQRYQVAELHRWSCSEGDLVVMCCNVVKPMINSPQ